MLRCTQDKHWNMTINNQQHYRSMPVEPKDVKESSPSHTLEKAVDINLLYRSQRLKTGQNRPSENMSISPTRNNSRRQVLRGRRSRHNFGPSPSLLWRLLWISCLANLSSSSNIFAWALRISTTPELLSSIVISPQQVGETLCACQPLTYEFTLNFTQTCDTDEIEDNAGIEEASTGCNTGGEDNVTDLIPVRLISATVLELNQIGRISKREVFPGPLFDGNSFNYTSFVATNSSAVNNVTLPNSLALFLRGRNKENQLVNNFVAIDYTNDCSVFPVLTVGEKIGWVYFSQLGGADPQFCTAAAGPTASPTTSLMPTTAPPTTPVPTTAAPTGVPTVTFVPTMSPPNTSAPTFVPTSAPSPLTPTTLPPTLDIPTSTPTKTTGPTVSPTTDAPVTVPPTSIPTMSVAPVTAPPTSVPTMSVAPVTAPPTSVPTISVAPVTAPPTPVPTISMAPATPVPTTASPVTSPPSASPTPEPTAAPSASQPTNEPTACIPAKHPKKSKKSKKSSKHSKKKKPKSSKMTSSKRSESKSSSSKAKGKSNRRGLRTGHTPAPTICIEQPESRKKKEMRLAVMSKH